MLSILLNLLGAILSLFIYWKKLREDYATDVIFLSGSYAVLCMAIALVIARYFFGLYWFWFALSGLTVGYSIAIVRFKMRIFEVLDAAVISMFSWMTLIFLDSIMVRGISQISSVGFVVMVLLIAVYNYVDSHYKRFVWYKSGRVGLAGLVAVGLFFTLRVPVAYLNLSVLSLSGRNDIFLSISFFIFAIFAIYYLATRTI